MMKFPKCTSNRRIEGVITPGIIRNGDYFLTEFSIYEDGIIDCWGSLDFPLLKKKLRSKWVVPNIPEKELLTFSMIGQIQVLDANWAFKNEKQYFNFVKSIVKELNPSMENLFDMKGSDTFLPKGSNLPTAKLMRMRPEIFKESMDIFSGPVNGMSFKHFMKKNRKYYFVQSTIFEDESVIVSGMPEEQLFELSEFKNKLINRDEFEFPKTDDRIVINNLVEFTAGTVYWYLKDSSMLQNFESTLRELKGEPSLVQICVNLFDEYKANPTKENLKKLRAGYESVPEHERMFCGDQDTKDVPIRIALYGESELEKWSHWQLAKEQGLPLPSIKVPKTIN